MPANPQKFSFLLSGGMDNRNMDDLISPTVQHGSTPHVARSVNTRFGVVPGRVVRAPAATKFADFPAGTKVMGLVSEAKSRRTAIMLHPGSYAPESGLQISNNLDDSPFQTGAGRDVPRDERHRYLGALSCRGFMSTERSAYGTVAVAKNSETGVVWRAHLGTWTSFTLRVIEGFLGESLVMSTSTSITDAAHWVGVTCHGATHECVVWTANTSTGAIVGRRISRDASSDGFSDTFFTAATAGAVAHGLDVVAISDTEAALVYPSASDPDDATLAIVDITTGTVSTSTTETGALATGGGARLAFGNLGGNDRIAAAYVSPDSSQCFARIYSTSLATVGTTSAEPCAGRAEIALAVGAAASNQRGFMLAVDDTTLQRVALQAYDETGASLGGATDTVYERSLTGHTASLTIDPDCVIPLFGMVRRWSRTDDDIGEANYVDDPALEIWWFPEFYGNNASLAATLGCVRGSAAPFDYFAGVGQISPSPGLAADASTIHAVYLQFNGQSDLDTLRQVSHSVLTLDGSHKPVAFDRDGPGLLASAVPAWWDGASMTPLGSPIEAPHITATIGSGTAKLDAGTYGVLAIFEWVDAAGLVHRSRPSNLVSETLDGASDLLTLTVSASPPLSTTQSRVKLYMTDTNGTSYHLHSTGSADPFGSTFSDLGPVNTAQEQIYTTQQSGEELAPRPPPPAADIAVIGDRCWILDAEIRSRYVFSKRRIAGTAFEFVPSFEVFLPSGAGEGVAVREFNGLVILIAERGVFQVSGSGPDNTLGGVGSFATPVKVSDIGCSNTASVVQYPGGIMWQDRGRFVRMSGAGIAYDRVFACEHDVSAACVMSRHQEILFFSASQAEIRVYNYELDRWSVWDSQVLGGAVTSAHTFAGDADKVVTWSEGVSEGSYLDADSVSSAANMTVETGWIAPGGDLQDGCELDRVILNGRHDGGDHDLTIELFADYDETNAEPERTFDNSDLSTWGTGHGGRYSVRIEPTVEGGARVFKLRLTDTLASGGGMDPRHATVVFRREDIMREDAFVAGSDV